MTTLDKLGRTIREETTAPNMPSQTTVAGYDVHGSPAYRSDGALTARLTQRDALGRVTGTVTSDGVQSVFETSPWGEVTDEETSHASITLSHAHHLFASQGTPVHTAWHTGSTLPGTTSPAFRSRYTLWDEGGKVVSELDGFASNATMPPGTIAAIPELRQTNTTYDSAGRAVETFRKGNSATFAASRATSFDGERPTTVTETRPLRGNATFTTTIAYDAAGVAATVDAPGGYTTSTESDQLGNPLSVTPPGLPAQTATYDSRGLVVARTVPDPTGAKTLRYEYDANGGLTKRTDESGTESTLYDRDPLGRVTKITYPDQTFEEVEYQDHTGLVQANRDRAGQWLSYKYDAGGRLTSVHKGRDVAGPMIVRYDYAPVNYRLIRVANVNAACEYDDYDLLGRPRITRAVRYAPGGSLENPESLLPTDVHVQQHVWSVFDGERLRWRMPAAGSIPSSEPPSPWRSWIAERRDGGGNLLELTAASSATGSAPSDFVIFTATPAGLGELATRSVKTNAGTSIDSIYRYHDASLSLPQELGGGSALAQQDPTASLRGVLVTRAAAPIAGTDVYRSASGRIGAQQSLGIGARASLYQYDVRGRLRTSSLDVSTWPGSSAAGGTTDVLSEADFRKERIPTPAFSAPQHALLGPSALTVEPPAWKATETPGHQIDQRRLLLDGEVRVTRQYAFAGGRRQTDGVWTTTYDELGRLTQMQSAGRRIVATYDPNDRLVGRSAYRLDGSEWVLEDRADVPNADGLPAEVTFVWDPVSDRLLEIAEARASTRTAAPPDAGLLRQYVHGDQGYDDPVEVLAADRATATVQRYLPIRDEAGTGSLLAVVDGATGNLAERVLYGDAYGDAPRYLQGPVVDKITADVTKDGAGGVETFAFHVHLSERLAASSIAGGVAVQALTSNGSEATPPLGTPSIAPDDPFTVTVTLNAAQWQALQAAPGAASIRLAVTQHLRAEAWGDTPVTPAPAWAVKLYGVATTPALPLSVRESVSTLAAFVAAASAGQNTRYPTVYSVPSLYLAGAEQSKTKLFTVCQALPFADPATGLVYARARWFDPQTGSFLSADPIGYRDSSNLYAYAGGDPVNHRDPTGLLCETSNAAGVIDWMERCNEDALNVEKEFARGLFQWKTFGRAAAGVVGTGKMIGKTVVGIGMLAVDQARMQLGDVDAGMRQGQRVLAIAHAVRHPIDTIVDAHTRAADNILAAEQSGHWFRASVEAGEIGSEDAAAIAGAVEGGVALARVTTRAATRMGLLSVSEAAGRAQFAARESAMLSTDVGSGSI